MPPIPTDAFTDTRPSPSQLEQLEALITRDRRRKLLVALPAAAVVGTAVACQATWLLAIAATGFLGVQALRRSQH